ncbi:MAG TPA: tol-pal system-associated acyl-CoA thioesterase [Chromatiaceae bacterium]|jgi:acyl-CoA thioester hydrolase|nr:tol-pal system-associated acyl-CoA thioesterase [Chromatiaceae bacterium]HIA07704.1 tol-pal system-associated acyl-CoA thioesterase [Chromatiaceae bacterium]HIN82309.1 tol-pal system-associated acyl-CoA thioesterase [Chromatiales bacterium]HIO55200.1 tol-pal system-associated acyl-CoA thioesterase [Chromatiales bacterium]
MSEHSDRFFWPVRIYYEDTDSGGVVYYANYLKYMERARTEWLRSLGFEQDELIAKEGILFAVRSVQLDYHLPAQFNDHLHVGVEIVESGHVSVTFDQRIYRDDERRPLLCTGQVRIACLDAVTFRPKRFPEALLPNA